MPLPFEYLDGQIYAEKDSKSVQVKTSDNGWNNHQATIILAAFSSEKLHETLWYHNGVKVWWNETAYANSELLVDWINKMLIPLLLSGP
ncbi:hypothetical protein L873DRAFT_1903012 [Choiromyces venosus 120613-1]|uniref:DDE-1 domain-containing protein n=1 Tax=Choiromyces venosus 120613-1 TaxID=1336337 RepID=A0A3N4K2B3_9PEZI|nr:hypothetical protein L873DRAFT_1903012 [Choiromyces venosus 120613-1]